MTVAYQERPVLWQIDLEVPKGKLVGILGPNGAGKSTLLKSILGQVKPILGSVDFQGTKKKQIAYVPQSESVDWDFPATVFDLVLMGCYGNLGWGKSPQKEEKRKTMKALEALGMDEFSKRQIKELSGGERQRVFLARALMQEAEIYLMDEPFKGVDIQTEESIVSLLQDLVGQGKTVLVVHHDLTTVPEYFQWIAMIQVQLIASGLVEEVFTKENLEKTFGSDKFRSKWVRE
ncbi:MAG: metal ABC transporter ATP-binding protein [Eubacteriales bacterium]